MRLKKTTLVCLSFLASAFLVQAADNVPPSQNPPGGLQVLKVPQFVVFGFDDNYSVEGMRWILDYLKDRKNPVGKNNSKTFDGTPTRATFYCNTNNSVPVTAGSEIAKVYSEAYTAGHEIGDHTKTHNTTGGKNGFTEQQWTDEISPCKTELTNIGIPGDKIIGFRTPFLNYNNNTFSAIKKVGFVYDCSIEEGYEGNQDGTNLFWPHTLDNGSPGHAVNWLGNSSNPESFTFTAVPGMWEVPAYAVIAPPDTKCEQYGIAKGFTKKLKGLISWLDENTCKITGLDYNLWSDTLIQGGSVGGGLRMTKTEFLGTLKYSFDLRYSGNRAPFTFGAHSPYYTQEWAANKKNAPNVTLAEMRAAMEEFITYVLSKPDVRVVPANKLLEWMRNPTALDNVVITVDTTNPSENFAADTGYWDKGSDDSSKITLTFPARGSVKAEYTRAKQANPDDWPWVSLSAYFDKPLTKVNYIKIAYKSDRAMSFSLNMPVLSDSGCTHAAQLEATAGAWKTVLLQTNGLTFKQPSWTPTALKKDLDLSQVTDVSFSPVDEDVTKELTGTLEIKELILYNYDNPTHITFTTFEKNNLLSVIDIQKHALHIGVDLPGMFRVIIYSVDGKQIKDFGTRSFVKGINTVFLAANTLSSQVYLISIQGNDMKQVSRVFIK